MREADLKAEAEAEAKAWRRAAVVRLKNAATGALLQRMRERATGHILDTSAKHVVAEWPDESARVIFCLLLALECEEEARHAPR